MTLCLFIDRVTHQTEFDLRDVRIPKVVDEIAPGVGESADSYMFRRSRSQAPSHAAVWRRNPPRPFAPHPRHLTPLRRLITAAGSPRRAGLSGVGQPIEIASQAVQPPHPRSRFRYRSAARLRSGLVQRARMLNFARASQIVEHATEEQRGTAAQPGERICSTRCRNASGGNGFDKYGCPEPSNSTILSGLPVIMRVFAPALAACLTRLVLEPSVSTTSVASKSGTSTARVLMASAMVATAVALWPACSSRRTSL